MKILKLATTLQSDDSTQTSGKFSGIANSLDFTRSGIRVSEQAGQSVVGQTVPLLLSHDWEKPSIGVVKMTSVDDDGLHYEATLYEHADNRELLLEGIANGTNYVSIGFGADGISSDGTIDNIDLLELSLTSTPADSKATAELIKQAIEQNKEEITMSDDTKTQAPAPTPAPTSGDDAQPTLSDILKAVQSLTALVTKALDPDADDANNSKPDNDTQTQEVESLKEANAELLSIARLVKRNNLSVKQSMFLAHQKG